MQLIKLLIKKNPRNKQHNTEMEVTFWEVGVHNEGASTKGFWVLAMFGFLTRVALSYGNLSRNLCVCTLLYDKFTSKTKKKKKTESTARCTWKSLRFCVWTEGEFNWLTREYTDEKYTFVERGKNGKNSHVWIEIGKDKKMLLVCKVTYVVQNS